MSIGRRVGPSEGDAIVVSQGQADVLPPQRDGEHIEPHYLGTEALQCLAASVVRFDHGSAGRVSITGRRWLVIE